MRLLVLLVLCAHAPFALAVYKCKNGEHTSYSDQACSVGVASEINTAVNSIGPEPVPENSRLQQQKAELQRLQETRLRREAQEDKAAKKAAKTRATQQKKCAKLKLQQKWREEDATMAVGKTAEKIRLKARRGAEEVRLACG